MTTFAPPPSAADWSAGQPSGGSFYSSNGPVMGTIAGSLLLLTGGERIQLSGSPTSAFSSSPANPITWG